MENVPKSLIQLSPIEKKGNKYIQGPKTIGLNHLGDLTWHPWVRVDLELVDFKTMAITSKPNPGWDYKPNS